MSSVAMRRFPRFTVWIVLLLLSAGMFPVASAAPAPTLALRRARPEIVLERSGPSSVFLNGGVFVASIGGAFELQARRADYDEPIRVVQVITAADGSRATRALPGVSVSSFSQALEGFFNVRVTNDAGDVFYQEDDAAFCPNGSERVRVDGTGPTNPIYPDGCFANQWMRGTLWGIEKGWASSAPDDVVLDGPDGHYRLVVSVNEPYRSLFGVSPAEMTVGITLQTTDCAPSCAATTAAEAEPTASLVGDRSSIRGAATSVVVPHAAPTVATIPGSQARPDLVATPAWNMLTEVHNGHDFLDFAAMIWDRGPSPLVVEGFRPQDAGHMDAYQYFYRDGRQVGQAPVGTMAYDPRPGHEHWHFEDFARYVLTDSSKVTAVRSQKDAFCLIITDAMDLSLPGAALRPFDVGLDSACGEPGSIWLRQVLHAGWGDTYTQSLPGQSFDITGLPNGTYYVKIIANPRRVLYESRSDNNVAFRRIILGGTPGNRTVRVPPYHGLDTETDCFPFC